MGSESLLKATILYSDVDCLNPIKNIPSFTLYVMFLLLYDGLEYY